jgi:hypothetical protein
MMNAEVKVGTGGSRAWVRDAIDVADYCRSVLNYQCGG